MSVISVTNQKGGVGKTTLTFNLAKGLADRNFKVLVVDNDPQGNLTLSFVQPDNFKNMNTKTINLYEGKKQVLPLNVYKNIDLIGTDISLSRVADGNFEVIYSLKESLAPIINSYDFVLIDCLPSFGYLNMAALNTANYVLVPTKPSPFALTGLRDLFETFEKAKKRLNPDLEVLGIILNLVEGRKTTIGEELEEVIRQNYSKYVFKTKLIKGVKFEESPAFCKSIMEYDPKGKLSNMFESFVDEFLKKINGKTDKRKNK